MGLALLAYLLQVVSGSWLFYQRRVNQPQSGLRTTHILVGSVMVFLVLLLLAIGIVGTLGHYGTLGHSAHLPAGLGVVGLVLLSAWSATQISPTRPWAKSLHLGLNVVLFAGFVWVSLTGWDVVQKYLP